jgi:hypothetical protein
MKSVVLPPTGMLTFGDWLVMAGFAQVPTVTTAVTLFSAPQELLTRTQ